MFIGKKIYYFTVLLVFQLIFALDLSVALDDPTQAREQVALQQRLGEKLGLSYQLNAPKLGSAQIGEFMDGKPTILVPAYYRCPKLCSLVLNGVLKSINKALRPGIGA